MLTRFLLALVATIFVSTTTAFAAEPKAKAKKVKAAPPAATQPAPAPPAPVPAPPAAAPAYKWTGFYAGVNVGYAIQSADISDNGSFNGATISSKDLLYGIAGGYDHRLPNSNIVLGVMAGYDWTESNSALTQFDGSWYVLGRGGILLSESLLAYGLVGYTSMDGGFKVASFTDNFQGMTYGLGLETVILPNTSLKLEWRYVDMGDGAVTGTGLGGNNQNFNNADTGEHSIRLGLQYRFNLGQ